MSPFFPWDEHRYEPFKALPPTPSEELLWVECPVWIQHTLFRYVIPLTFPLPSLLQVLPNAEPLSMKLCAYPSDTRAAAVPWFLTQGEVSTSHLRNISHTCPCCPCTPSSHLTPSWWRTDRLPWRYMCIGPTPLPFPAAQSHSNACIGLYLLHPVVSPCPLPPQPDSG